MKIGNIHFNPTHKQPNKRVLVLVQRDNKKIGIKRHSIKYSLSQALKIDFTV